MDKYVNLKIRETVFSRYMLKLNQKSKEEIEYALINVEIRRESGLQNY